MKRPSDSSGWPISMSAVCGGALFASVASALLAGGLVLAAAPGEESSKAASAKEDAGKRPLIEIDKKAQKVSLAAVAARQNVYEQLKGAIEYVLVCKGGKEYESLFTTECKPEAVSAAFQELELYAGRPAGRGSMPWGAAFRIFAEYEEAGKKKRRAVDEFVLHSGRGKPLEMGTWTFTASVKARDPATKKEALQCLVTKHLVGLHFADPSPLFQNSREEARQENIYKTELTRLPKEGTPVKLVFERVRGKPAEGAKRVHVFLRGRVQGVGFRAFTQREARRLKLSGFVRNLKDGRVEAIVEGPPEAIGRLMEKVKRGPRSARVDGLESKDVPPMGDFESFRIER